MLYHSLIGIKVNGNLILQGPHAHSTAIERGMQYSFKVSKYSLLCKEHKVIKPNLSLIRWSNYAPSRHYMNARGSKVLRSAFLKDIRNEEEAKTYALKKKVEILCTIWLCPSEQPGAQDRHGTERESHVEKEQFSYGIVCRCSRMDLFSGKVVWVKGKSFQSPHCKGSHISSSEQLWISGLLSTWALD